MVKAMSFISFLLMSVLFLAAAIAPKTAGTAKPETRTSGTTEEIAYKPMIRNSLAIIGHHGSPSVHSPHQAPASASLIMSVVAADGKTGAVIKGDGDSNADANSTKVAETPDRPVQVGNTWAPTLPLAVPIARQSLFDTASFSMWIILGTVTISLVIFDFVVLQKFTPDAGIAQHLCVLCFWVLVGLSFNVLIFNQQGKHASMQWTTGYLLEWMLSMDNIFVFHLVFRSFNTPRNLQHKSLFVGILGAALFRMIFFVTVSYVLSTISWIHYIFGFLLVWSGMQALFAADEGSDVPNLTIVRVLKGILGDRLLDRYDLEGCNLFVAENGKWCATLLVPVAVCLELVDIVFAADSVGAKVSQIPDTFIAYTSSLLAMFGLRSLFFIIEDMVESFELLKYGLCFILVFIGAELIFSNYVQLPTPVVFGVITLVFVVCIGGSVLRAAVVQKQLPERPSEPDSPAQPEEPQQAS